jgi:hypothetical protein
MGTMVVTPVMAMVLVKEKMEVMVVMVAKGEMEGEFITPRVLC